MVILMSDRRYWHTIYFEIGVMDKEFKEIEWFSGYYIDKFGEGWRIEMDL